MSSKIDALFSDFNKSCKYDLVSKGVVLTKCERIPFSSCRANYMLYGGIPRGRLTEFAGAESSGKTTSCLDIVKNAQELFFKEWADEIEALENSATKLSKTQSSRLNEIKERGPLQILFVDCENTFNPDWAELIGVDANNMYLMKPQSQSAEQIFDMVLEVINTGEIGLCIIDSYGAMVSQQELEKDMTEKTYCGIAGALTKFSKLAEMSCAKTNCALIGINQVRDNMAAGYGGPLTTTPGGRAWKHHCSVRLEFRQGNFFDENYKDVKKSCENPAGNYVNISVVKSKVGKNNRKLGFYSLNYSTGIDFDNDMINLLIYRDIIHQSGAWFTFNNVETGDYITNDDGEVIKIQGQANIRDFLMNNEYLYDMYVNYVNKIVSGDVV